MKARQCDCDLRDLLRERLKLDGSPHSSVQFAPRGFDRPVLRSPIAGLLLKRSFSKVQGAYCGLLSRICCSERVVAVSRQPIHLGLLFPKALRYPFHERLDSIAATGYRFNRPAVDRGHLGTMVVLVDSYREFTKPDLCCLCIASETTHLN
jgi:hypothetical protein